MDQVQQTNTIEPTVDPNLYFKTRECRNRQHLNCTDARILERCGYYHSEEDRFVFMNNKRLRWTPRLESQLIAQQNAAIAERDAYWASVREQKRQTWIAELKKRPNYKTSPCRLEEPHDEEACAFSHGYDYNEQGAIQLGYDKVRNQRPSHNRRGQQSDPKRDYNATANNDAYEAAFPSLTSS
jgi:hypothetical protein